MKGITTSLLLLTCFPVLAQRSSHLGLLPTIDHSGSISRTVDYSFYYFSGLNLANRYADNEKQRANLFVIYGEQALSYKPNEHLSFTASYVFERQHPLEDSYRNEQRFYLQTAYSYTLNRTKLKHRMRFDGRFIENRSSGNSPFTSRIRYLFGVTTPWQKNWDKIYINLYNEFFFNTYKGAASIYGENWAYAGVGLHTKQMGSFEAGPLYIFWVNNNEGDLSNFYYLQFTWISHISFLRKT